MFAIEAKQKKTNSPKHNLCGFDSEIKSPILFQNVTIFTVGLFQLKTQISAWEVESS